MRNTRWLKHFTPSIRSRSTPASGRRRRLAAPEQLEARLLLAGDFTNAPISDAEMAAVLDGLDGFAEFGRDLSQTGQLAQPLALLEGDPDQPIVVGSVGKEEKITIGDALKIGDVIGDKLAGPVRTYLEGLAPVDRNTDGLVAFLESLPEVTTVMGGLATMPADELRFELTFQIEVQLDGLGIDLGPPGDALGISIQDSPDVSLMVAMNIQFAFGVDRNPELNAEQAFFVRGTTIGVAADVHVPRGIMEEEGIYYFLVGFLGVDGPDGMIDLDADLDVTLNDVVPDPLGNVTLSELNGYAASELANIDVAANSVAATFDVTATVGSWTPVGVPQITVSGVAVDPTDPGHPYFLTTNGDFAELLNFNNVDAEQLLTGLETLGSWLAGFADSAVLDVDVPFASGATLGNTIVASDEYFALIAALRDADGLPLFGSAQQFAAGPTVDIDYDPVANRLVFPITLNFAPSQSTASLALGDGSQAANERCVFPLCGLETDTLATLTAASVVEFDLGVDLSTAGQLVEDQFSTNNLVVRGGVLQNAMNLAGAARYGLIGIDFADGMYSGTSSFRADIVDPNTGDSRATLGELLAGLGDPELLLGPPLALLGSTNLVLDDVTIQDGLFAIPAGASFTASVADFAQPTVTSLVETGIGTLGNFANFTQDFLVDSVASGLISAAKWTVSEFDAITSIGLSIADFVETQVIETVADAVQAGFDAFQAATGAAARLQDVATVFAVTLPEVDDEVLVYAANFAVNTATATLDFGLTIATETAQQVIETGLNISELEAAAADELMGVGEFAGTFDPVNATVSNSFDIDFQFDLAVSTTPVAYLLTTSALTAEVYVEEVSLTGDGSLGVLGLGLDQGSLVIAADRLMPNPAAPATFTVGLDDSAPGGRVPLDQVDTAMLESSATGQMDFNFRVTVEPSGMPEPNRFHFRTNNLNNPGGSTAFPTPPPDFPTIIATINLPDNVSALPGGLHDLLGGVADAFDTNIFGLAFPLVGNALAGVANFISDLQEKLDAALDATTGFLCDNIEDAIETGLGLTDDQLLQDCTNPDDIRFTLMLSGQPINDPMTGMPPTISIHSDFGLPALGATADAELEVEVFYDVELTFGVSVADGVYLDTASEVLSAGVRVNLIEEDPLADPNPPEFFGTLGFIKVSVENTSPSPTVFDLTFDIDLTDPNNNDDRLTVTELADAAGDPGSLINEAATGVMGSANLQLQAKAEIIDFLPAIQADFAITWDFDGSNLTGSVPEVTLDVSLDLGPFFSQTLLPILEPLKEIVGGIDLALDVVTDPLPVPSDLIGPTSIADVAATVLPSPYNAVPKAIIALAEVIDIIALLVDAAEAESDSTIDIGLGRLEFGTAQTSGFDARRPDLTINLNQQVFGEHAGDDLYDDFINLSGDFGVFSNQFIATEGAQLEFPFLTNPLSVFEFLLGFGDAEIITLKLPSVEGTIPFELLVPIFAGVVKAGMVGSIDIHAALSGGYDTFGLREFFRTGDGEDIAKGFYLSDRENADGTGPDIPEISVGGDVLAAVVLDAVVASVGVGGGVFAEVAADLIDHDGDGKIRGNELKSDKGCLQLTGSVGVELAAFVELLGFIRDEFPFVRQELGSFHTTLPCPNFGGEETGDVLAKLNAGQLNLLVGTRANERTIEQDVIDESFTVYKDGSRIVVTAFGVEQSFAAASVDSIRADAGGGHDNIFISSDVMKPAELIGDNGFDTLTGGGGDDTIDGGFGDDLLDGQGGRDSITAGNGNDLVFGGDEDSPGDTIDGGIGDDEIHGGDGDDVITTGDGLNLVYGDGGNDSITGGANVDVLNGGDEDDDIFGLGDEDVLLGDGGADEIFGGDASDVIDGGSGGDTIHGEGAGDVLYGGSDDDVINGNDGFDYIEGGSEDDDITGGIGVDTIRGGTENDTIRGNDGDDLLFGEEGDDSILGQQGEDTIEGGPNNDDLVGGDDNDLIHGDDGNDVISGGLGADLLYGDANSDTIHGNGGSPPGSDGTCDTESDNDADTIYGGTSGDIITGDCDVDLIFGEDGNDNIHGNDGDDSVLGGIGNDEMFGDFGIDTLEGEDGNDTIEGGNDDDSVRGGNGNDSILGQAGADLLFGDAGNDTVEGGAQPDLIDGGANNDHLIGNGDVDQIFGNVGGDIIEGNDGDDLLRGNPGEDLIYGDAGGDDIAGGPDNDTIRGGEDNDTARGGLGDDLILGHTGDDDLFGDAGNDVLYGYLGADVLTGGADNDRAFGQLGDDVLNGDDGDDILEGGPGNDTASGGTGRDALYGDGGVDSLSGGDDDDFIMAGDGIGDVLNGDKGNDEIVGSDDGDADPNFGDTTFFGDVINGGDNDDLIRSLGGADVIKAEDGDDTVIGGTHVDSIDGGTGVNVIEPDSPLVPPVQSLSAGPDVGGHWGELNGSATDGGLTQVGGFEEATFATDGGVYVAWVDWRNGNSEIYLAFHGDGSGLWTSVNGSASGGGISNDADQSRRPTIVELVNGVDQDGKPRKELLVAWTSIKPDGTSRIEVARKDGLVWTRVVNPAQTGTADNARLVRYSDDRSNTGIYSDDSALLGWLDSASGVDQVALAQYVFEPGCFSGFFGPTVGVTTQFRGTEDVTKFDLAAVRFRAVVATSYGSAGDHDIDVAVAQNVSEFDPCPALPNSPITTPSIPAGWNLVGTFTDGDAIEPAVGMRFLAVRSLGQNENQYQSDIYVAWHEITDRTDQVVGKVSFWDFTGGPQPWEDLIPQYFNQAPRGTATSISDTIGYAAKPNIATSDSYMFLAWMDDGVHTGLFGDGDGGSSIHVMSALGASRTVSERLPTDASNGGISPTGGSADSISIATEREGLDSGSPYAVWTDHYATAPSAGLAGPGAPQVLLRHDLDVPQFFVLVTQTGGATSVTEGGATDTYSIVLMSQPSNNVRIDLNPSTGITLSTAPLIFTTANWFTPQVVTVTAVNDTKSEGQHAATIGHSVASLDPDYNGLAVNPVTVQIRDNDFGITDFVPEFAGTIRKRTIASVMLATVGVVEPADVNTQNFRLSQAKANGAGKPVALRSIVFDDTSGSETVTLTPLKPLNLNKTYLLTVSNLGDAAAAQPFLVNVATTLPILDRDGDRATLTLGGSPGFGYFKTLGTQDPALTFRTTIAGSGTGIVLAGTAKRSRTGDGIVTPPASQTLGVAPGTTFLSTLTNPPVRIGPLPQATVDELLLASGGTLAGVLVAV